MTKTEVRPIMTKEPTPLSAAALTRAAPATAAAAKSLSLTLARLRRAGRDGRGPTLAEMTGTFADRALPFAILVFGLFGTVPSPGLPTGAIFGTLIVLLAVRLLIGHTTVHLPRFVRDRRVPRRALEAVLRRSVPVLRRVERRTRPRLTVLTSRPLVIVTALLLIAMGAVLALPIPFGNSLPGAAIVALSLGLLTRDGLGMIAGYVLCAGSAAYVAALAWGAGGLAAMMA
ncbi:exopolysaccharide biosynthesis protein [Caenispirillum salinarum]|uniref:exopolysaccharide biosynthesis protein n=1 Tax=Caenispirillum salinarum TaxID=859058 RepID=UPI003850A0FE